MTKRWIDLNIGQRSGRLELKFYDNEDLPLLMNMYRDWVHINLNLEHLGERKLNAPEILSEGITCLYLGIGRAHKPRSMNVENLSMDAVSEDGERIEIKSTTSSTDAPNSFSPQVNDFERLVFVDFYSKGLWDGDIDIYELVPFSDSDIMVNKTESFRDQQNQGRRPRFSLRKFIKEEKIEVISHIRINIYETKI